jgi:hypothetical protein
MKDILTDAKNKTVRTWNDVLNSRVKTAQVVASTTLFVLVSAFYVASDNKKAELLREQARPPVEQALTQFFNVHGALNRVTGEMEPVSEEFHSVMRRAVYENLECKDITEVHNLYGGERALFKMHCDNLKKQISKLTREPG